MGIRHWNLLTQLHLIPHDGPAARDTEADLNGLNYEEIRQQIGRYITAPLLEKQVNAETVELRTAVAAKFNGADVHI